MRNFQPATLLRLHVCERDQYKGRAVHKCILERCRELHITRVSAVRAFEGYGGESEVHRSRLLRHNLPIVLTIIDTPEQIARLLPSVEEMIDTGMIAQSPIEMIAVNGRSAVQAAS